MRYPSDLPRLLSRASLRAYGLMAITMALGVFETVKAERAYTAFYANSARIPLVDNMMINVWAGGQLHVLQACLALWVALLGVFFLLDRGVRRGSGLALAGIGATGLAMHFVNLPALAWDAVARHHGIRTTYELDEVPGFLGQDDLSPVGLVSPFMRLRLDPLAWGMPDTAMGAVLGGLFLALWAATLAVSVAALYVGLRSRLPQGARAVPAAA